MRYYMGSFKNVEKYKNKGFLPISISTSNPDWYTGLTELIFAPPFELEEKFKNKLISEEEYKDEYIKQLDINHIEFLLENYPKMFKDQNIVFVSNEDNGVFSHRTILADYFDEKLDVELDELLAD